MNKRIEFAFLVGIVAFVFGKNGMAQPQSIDKIVAVVGNEIVLQSDINEQRIQAFQQGYNLGDDAECLILEDLLFQKLLLNQSRLDSIEIPEAQVESEINRRLQVFIQQIGSEEQLEAFYEKTIEEIKEDFREPIEEQMRIQSMQGQITSGINTTPDDVESYFNQIPKDSIPYVNAIVQVAQIVKYPPVSNEERKRVIERAKKFRQDIQDGKDFATLAILYSEDPGSSQNGGELGLVSRGSFVPEFDAIAFRLKEGQVSKVFETQFGFHIMQLIERRGEQYNARHILLRPKVRGEDLQKAKTFLDSIATLIQADSLTFEQAAQQFSEDEETKNNGGVLVNPISGTSKFEMNEIDPQIFFTIDQLESGEVSLPVIMQTLEGKKAYRLLKLVSRSEPHVANLKQDYDMIQEAALANLREEKLNKWMKTNIKKTFIRIDDDRASCNFNYDWQ